MKTPFNSKLWLMTILIVISMSVYVNALQNGFVYDDNEQIITNRWIKDVKHIPLIFTSDIWGFWGEKFQTNYYRPFMYLTFMAEYHLFGLSATWFHFTNILLHAANTLLVFLIGASLFRHFGAPHSLSSFLSPPFVAALLFATHPIHTEAVTWVSGVPELSFTLFCLLSFYFYLRSTDKNHFKPIPVSGYWHPKTIISPLASGFYLLSLFFYFLSLLCKETAITFILIIMTYDYAKSVRDNHSKFANSFSRFFIFHLLNRYVFYFIVIGLYFLLRNYAIGGLAPMSPRHADLTTFQYIINVFPLIIKYFWKLLLPVDLNLYHVFHPVYSILEPKAMISILLVVAFIIVLFTIRRVQIPFFSILWIIIPLLPALYIPGVGENTFAERYLYLPSIGFVILVSYGLMRTVAWFDSRISSSEDKKMTLPCKVIMTTFLFLVVTLYSFGTFMRNYTWKDNLTLWTDTAEKSPDSYAALNNLGVEYTKKGLWDEGMEKYKAALEINPNYALSRNNLGLAYAVKGLRDEAISEYKKALWLFPEFTEAHYNLGIVYAAKGMLDHAIISYQKALKVNPNDVRTQYNLALALKDSGQLAKAEEAFHQTIRISPDHFAAYNDLGNTYFIQKKYNLAIQKYKEALILKPTNAESLYNLALCFERTGDLQDAITYYKRFIEAASAPIFNEQLAVARKRIKSLSTNLNK